jgi:outer membrane protein assembly factor BamB
VGNGIAAVAVAKGRVYIVGYVGEHEYVTALDERSGARLWTTVIGAVVDEHPSMRWLAQRTPTLDDDRVYAVHTSGQLVCLKTENGQELWRKDYWSEFGKAQFYWGYCDHPLVDGERLICAPGSPEAILVALDKHTGHVHWMTPDPEAASASYGSIVQADLGGQRQFIVCTGSSAIGVDADSGTILWRSTPSSTKPITTHTPVAIEQHILWVPSFGRTLVLLKPDTGGASGSMTESYMRETSKHSRSDSGFVLGDHYYYSARGGAVAGCTNWRTGEVAWSVRRPSPIAGEVRNSEGAWSGTFADGRLYSLSANGRVRLAAVSPVGLEEAGVFDLPLHISSTGATQPVATGGRLYLRSDNILHCYDVTRREDSQPIPHADTIVLEPVEPVISRHSRVPRPIFVPTPQDVVERMLQLAEVTKVDRVVDLGSGDGRIVITAARTYGCRAVGYEIDGELVKVSRQQIEADKLSELVEIKPVDMYSADLSDVSVVAVYVYPSVLEKMKPQFAKLPAGARIVSHQFEIPGVKPTRTIEVDSDETGGRHRVFLYSVPLTATDNSQ